MALKGRNTVIVRNRKARYEYFIDSEFEAGIMLTGTEVKSLRSGKASIQEAYCMISKEGEAFIYRLNIPPYEKANIFNHDPVRTRKLLLRKRELHKIRRKLEEKGMTLVPLSVYFGERNMVKIQLGLAKGKKSYDKRDGIKDRDVKREMDRAMKDY